eukprot:scaffold54569_cov45-Phaeocystis_antarctica.AAC.3
MTRQRCALGACDGSYPPRRHRPKAEAGRRSRARESSRVSEVKPSSSSDGTARRRRAHARKPSYCAV